MHSNKKKGLSHKACQTDGTSDSDGPVASEDPAHVKPNCEENCGTSITLRRQLKETEKVVGISKANIIGGWVAIGNVHLNRQSKV